MELTRRLASLMHSTTYEDIPPSSVTYAKQLMLSVIAGTVAGNTEEAGRIITDYVRYQAASPEVGVFGAGFKTTMDNAALAHNTLWHCTELEGNCYPEVVSVFMLVPPLVSVAEKFHLSGREFLEALIVGHEAQGRIGRAANPNPDLPGTTTYMNLDTMGILGIAAGVSKLLKFDNEKTAMALSLAASQASGIRGHSGSMAHYLESGLAARAGMSVALLANAGMTGRPEIMEIPGGFLHIWTNSTDHDADAIFKDWGNPFRVEAQEDKLYPCCSLMQHVIETTQDMLRQNSISAGDISQVEVETNMMHFGSCRFNDPANSDEAKFSFPHGVASAILDETVSLSSFRNHRITDPDMVTMRQKVKVTLHPEWEAGNLAQPHPVTITLNNGQQVRSESTGFTGHPPNIKPRDKFAEKFTHFSGLLLGPSQTSRCLDMILGLEDVKDVADLASELTYPRKDD